MSQDSRPQGSSSTLCSATFLVTLSFSTTRAPFHIRIDRDYHVASLFAPIRFRFHYTSAMPRSLYSAMAKHLRLHLTLGFVRAVEQEKAHDKQDCHHECHVRTPFNALMLQLKSSAYKYCERGGVRLPPTI